MKTVRAVLCLAVVGAFSDQVAQAAEVNVDAEVTKMVTGKDKEVYKKKYGRDMPSGMTSSVFFKGSVTVDFPNLTFVEISASPDIVGLSSMTVTNCTPNDAPPQTSVLSGSTTEREKWTFLDRLTTKAEVKVTYKPPSVPGFTAEASLVQQRDVENGHEKESSKTKEWAVTASSAPKAWQTEFVGLQVLQKNPTIAATIPFLMSGKVDFEFYPSSHKWVGTPPANTIRDDRGQFACSPRDRPGVGRAIRDNVSSPWKCQFGHDGHERTYDRDFDFLEVDPTAVQWVEGSKDRSIKSSGNFAVTVCRTNPDPGKWRYKEYGWVYNNGCVLGWGGSSPTFFGSYETLVSAPVLATALIEDILPLPEKRTSFFKATYAAVFGTTILFDSGFYDLAKAEGVPYRCLNDPAFSKPASKGSPQSVMMAEPRTQGPRTGITVQPRPPGWIPPAQRFQKVHKTIGTK